MATTHSVLLEKLAKQVVERLPAGVAPEVVLTGSVSRGMADEASEIEMLVVTRDRLALAEWLVDGAARVLKIVFAVNGDAVVRAPRGPDVDRARLWLAAGAEVLRRDGA